MGDEIGEASLHKMQLSLKKPLLQLQFMMAVHNQRITQRLNMANISQTGGKICVLSSTIWNKRKFGRSILKLKYQREEKLF
jgi:hypothetical protein